MVFQESYAASYFWGYNRLIYVLGTQVTLSISTVAKILQKEIFNFKTAYSNYGDYIICFLSQDENE